jgi:ethanolamine ammonia-lyase small subunit
MTPGLPDVEAALRQERLTIARMLHAEASKHEDAAAELRADYDHAEIADEAWAHDTEAEILNRYASLILSRTAIDADPADEIAF